MQTHSQSTICHNPLIYSWFIGNASVRTTFVPFHSSKQLIFTVNNWFSHFTCNLTNKHHHPPSFRFKTVVSEWEKNRFHIIIHQFDVPELHLTIYYYYYYELELHQHDMKSETTIKLDLHKIPIELLKGLQYTHTAHIVVHTKLTNEPWNIENVYFIRFLKCTRLDRNRILIHYFEYQMHFHANIVDFQRSREFILTQ